MTERLLQTRIRSPQARTFTGATILLLHLVPLAALILGTKPLDWRFFACVYPLQAIGVGVGLHRYFSHRSFKTSRFFQFVLALCSALAFGDPIGFSGKHRLHHQHSDQEGDVHSPLHGWWGCWFGSLLDHGYPQEAILARVPDLKRYPELMWLHRHSRVPGLVLIGLAFLAGGFTTAAIGVCLPAICIIHQTSSINYFAHRFGARRFDTPDLSTNNLWVALLCFGEGWHNNHHRFPHSARSGLTWRELDMFFWVIWVLEKLGLAWDVRRPPDEVLSVIQSNPLQTS